MNSILLTAAFVAVGIALLVTAAAAAPAGPFAQATKVEVKALIIWETIYGPLVEADWVIEAVLENLPVKEEVLGQVTGVAAMVSKIIEAFGKLDILVNNAGIIRDKTLPKLAKEDWDAVIAVNLTGAFHCASAVIGHMRERRYGRIISISSVVGQMGNIGQTNYAASKAGLIGFTKSLAREVARRGITVNAIAPGFIDTGMTQTIPEDFIEQIVATIPMGQMGQPEDIAHAALFLASAEASYITGHVLSVNGGLYM